MVVIKWHDARLYPDSYKKEECLKHNMCLFETLGYLISEDETVTRIAMERENEGRYRHIVLIPTGSIVSIEKLIFGAAV